MRREHPISSSTPRYPLYARVLPLCVLIMAVSAPAPAAAPAKLIVARADVLWTDQGLRGEIRAFSSDELAAKPAPGRYLAIGTRGPIARLALAGAIARPRGGCPYRATFTLAEKPAWIPGDDDHVVIIGPLGADPAAFAKARLLFYGLAKAGHAHAEVVEKGEALGVAPPPNARVKYAVDLDGDGKADLVLDHQFDSVPYVHRMLKTESRLRVWQRRDARWGANATCQWNDVEPID